MLLFLYTIMENNFVPSSSEQNQFETPSIKDFACFFKSMVHKFPKCIVIGSFLKKDTTFIEMAFEIGPVLTRVRQKSFP